MHFEGWVFSIQSDILKFVFSAYCSSCVFGYLWGRMMEPHAPTWAGGLPSSTGREPWGRPCHRDKLSCTLL